VPLPPTPLQRSEKKRPPSLALIRKMGMGTIREVDRDSKWVQYRD
jgi:hypothetical protein